MTTSTTTAALAVDLGSRTAAVWATHRGTVTGPCGDPSSTTGTLVRRGRIVDVDGCVDLLSHLVGQYPEPVPAGAVVVACRPVLASDAEQHATRRVLDAVFAPARVLFVDAVRAAAVGSGAAAGTLLVVDVGAELTEVGLLADGGVAAARRAEIGTRDLARGATVDLIADTVVRQVDGLRSGPGAAGLETALARGVLLVGDGAVIPAWPPRSPTGSGRASTGPPIPGRPLSTAPASPRSPCCAAAARPADGGPAEFAGPGHG